MVCLIFVSVVASAQSVLPADSVMEEFETELDTVYSSYKSSNDTVIIRSTPDSAIKRMQQMKEFAYANDPDYWSKEEEEEPQRPNWALIFLSAAFQYLLFGIFIVALIYVLVRILTENKIILFKRKKTHVSSQETDDILEAQDLSSLIAAAEQQGQFRLAARYRYLQLLENMNERQLIRLHSEFTNWDYIRQMGTHPLNSRFRYLTLAYEYVWYGEFELENEQYSILRKKFETFFH